MDYQTATYQYYSRWMGMDLQKASPGIYAAQVLEDDRVMPGFPRPVHICAWIKEGAIRIAYAGRAEGMIDSLIGGLSPDMSAGAIRSRLEDCFQSGASHSIKYMYQGGAQAEGLAYPLDEKDADLFLNFFRAAHPGITDTGWVLDYFYSICRKGYVFGVAQDGMLVCCTDAPDMPYMADSVQEIGINTLPEYRGRGYATQACAAAAQYMVSQGITPLWSTDISNHTSQLLAFRVGFTRLADMITISL